MHNPDEIRITGLKFYAYHGVYDSEKEKGQPFMVDITLRANLREAGISDNLTKTVNYAEAAGVAAEIFMSRKFDLIEAAAEAMAGGLLRKYSMLSSVSIEVYKPEAPIGMEFDNVSVYITRKRHKAYIAVGSNIGDGPATIEKASELLGANEDITIVKKSSLITTKPYGPVKQDDFTNGVWEVDTLLTPEELLFKMHETENALGRERLVHWGPRTIDLDIIYYDDLILDSEDLTIPHADMHNRDFVLKPLMELAPCKRHPLFNMTTAQMLEVLSAEG
ncbi:MAG: 2-amino-4-hydroxy-6-hydroxymethyldihydropteridine diphosphokinase [Lachnospiraceae bacterium]|nr:2-amino-4-hydroxy-6-hydroxymethyldihydropteridine diphosphokinase [Lachnospiraceae bacterium]